MRVLLILIFLGCSAKLSLSNISYDFKANDVSNGIVDWNNELLGGASQEIRDSIELYATELSNYLGGSAKVIFQSSYTPKAFYKGLDATISEYDQAITQVELDHPYHVAYFMAFNPYDKTVFSNTRITLTTAGLLSSASATILELISARAESVYINSLEESSPEFVAVAALHSIKSIVQDVFDFSKGDFGGSLTSADFMALGFVKTNYPQHLRMEFQNLSSRGAQNWPSDFANLRLFNDNTSTSFLYADKIGPALDQFSAYITSADGIPGSFDSAIEAHKNNPEPYSFWYHKSGDDLFLKIDANIGLAQAITTYNRTITDQIGRGSSFASSDKNNSTQRTGCFDLDWSTLLTKFQFKDKVMGCFPDSTDALFKTITSNVSSKLPSAISGFAAAYTDVYIGMTYGIADAFLGTVQILGMVAELFISPEVLEAWNSTQGLVLQARIAQAAANYVIADIGDQELSAYIFDVGVGFYKSAKSAWVSCANWFSENWDKVLPTAVFGVTGVLTYSYFTDESWQNAIDTAITAVWNAVTKMLSDLYADLTWQNGGRPFGWQVGALVFEIILEFATGGGAAGLKAARVSASSMVDGLAASAKAIVSKIKADDFARICLKNGCFVPSTKIATPLGLIPLHSVGPVFNPILIK